MMREGCWRQLKQIWLCAALLCPAQASGFLFKDNVEVNALDDPEGEKGGGGATNAAASVRQPCGHAVGHMAAWDT
jgi:hypothetical protein